MNKSDHQSFIWIRPLGSIYNKAQQSTI